MRVHLDIHHGIIQTQGLIYRQMRIGQSIHQTIFPAHDDHFQLSGYYICSKKVLKNNCLKQMGRKELKISLFVWYWQKGDKKR